MSISLCYHKEVRTMKKLLILSIVTATILFVSAATTSAHTSVRIGFHSYPRTVVTLSYGYPSYYYGYRYSSYSYPSYYYSYGHPRYRYSYVTRRYYAPTYRSYYRSRHVRYRHHHHHHW